MINIVAIVQARMGSTRLPGKVLMDILDVPMLAREVTRIGKSKKINYTVVATTKEPIDNSIIKMCKQFGFDSFRGHETDVLDRYYQCAHAFDADVVVRLTGDCPLIDPEIIDATIDKFLKCYPSTDYASNVFPVRTFPRGLDVEIMKISALETSWWDETNLALREHVTQHIIWNPERFTIAEITNDIDLSGMRWTVDEIEDFRFVHAVYSHFGNNTFSWKDVLKLVTAQPELQEINRTVQQKEIHPS